MEAFDWAFGCQWVGLERHSDKRGSLTVLTPKDIGETPYMYWSVTYAGEARDKDVWHAHANHTDRFVVLRGEAMFFVSDGETTEYLVLTGPYRMLIVPPGVWHRFKNIGNGQLEIVNLPDAVYDPADELRIPIEEAGETC